MYSDRVPYPAAVYSVSWEVAWDKVTAVVIPGCDDITDIEVVSDTEIRVTVPPDSPAGVGCLEDSERGYYNKNRVDIYGADCFGGFCTGRSKAW